MKKGKEIRINAKYSTQCTTQKRRPFSQQQCTNEAQEDSRHLHLQSCAVNLRTGESKIGKQKTEDNKKRKLKQNEQSRAAKKRNGGKKKTESTRRKTKKYACSKRKKKHTINKEKKQMMKRKS